MVRGGFGLALSFHAVRPVAVSEVPGVSGASIFFLDLLAAISSNLYNEDEKKKN